jgi:hypothetical protein
MRYARSTPAMAHESEIVLVTLALDLETCRVEPHTQFIVSSRRRGARYNRPCEHEPEVIAQFRPGEEQALFEAEWDEDTGNWIFGRRVDDA